MSSRVRRLLRLSVLAPVLLGSAACLNDKVTPRPLPTFTRMILRLAPTGGGIPQQVEIARATGTASGPLTVPTQGGLLTATFLNADGSDDEVLRTFPQEYETRIVTTSGPGAATFERASPNSFQVSRVTTGAATVVVQLWDLGLKREVLGSTTQVTVQ